MNNDNGQSVVKTDAGIKHGANDSRGTAVVKPVRHAEKRRISTCSFADRIAAFCVDHYRMHVPMWFRDQQKQTCVAAIVALCQAESLVTVQTDSSITPSSRLYVLGMGVGTKFLSSELLKKETESPTQAYGSRVRDCHAEVLARRAFRRQLSLCMIREIEESTNRAKETCEQYPPILERLDGENTATTFRLKPGVSLHMYTSSAPCGNATLKKFATMKKESFREDLTEDQWPKEPHERILGHSIPLGQFALLVKKDPGASNAPILRSSNEAKHQTTATSSDRAQPNKRPCLALETTDWCPPGTSTVWAEEGSLHTCSDKICRWNCLGLQGSLLVSLLEGPLYMSSLTVGRKLTECICRRAVCCRAASRKSKGQKKQKQETKKASADTSSNYMINHPAILGTAVYLDDDGVIGDEDVRFHSTLSWAWWPAISLDQSADPRHSGDHQGLAECIDGTTGFAVLGTQSSAESTPQSTPCGAQTLLEGPKSQSALVSLVSTLALCQLYHQLSALITNTSGTALGPVTLSALREFKQQLSPFYEAHKQVLLTNHPLFRQWKRRAGKLKETPEASKTSQKDLL